MFVGAACRAGGPAPPCWSTPRASCPGIFTDSDLARLFESRRDEALDRPIRDVMTVAPVRVPQGSMMVDAVAIMAERKISELPVVDAEGSRGPDRHYRRGGPVARGGLRRPRRHGGPCVRFVQRKRRCSDRRKLPPWML